LALAAKTIKDGRKSTRSYLIPIYSSITKEKPKRLKFRKKAMAPLLLWTLIHCGRTQKATRITGRAESARYIQKRGVNGR
jgi:hypothetical protein